MTVYATPDAGLVRRVTDILRSRLRKRGVNIYVSGIDGSGKTTLAQALAELLRTSATPARHLHIYQWYLSVLWTPLVLLHNRYIGRKVLLFDRGIYDNVAVLAARPGCPAWLVRAAIGMAIAAYPKADYHFYLVTTLTETAQRRPDTCAKRFAALGRVYEEIGRRARCITLRSDTRLLGATLHSIAGEA